MNNYDPGGYVRTKTSRLLAAATVTCLLFAACGGDDDEATSAGASSADESSATAESTSTDSGASSSASEEVSTTSAAPGTTLSESASEDETSPTTSPVDLVDRDAEFRVALPYSYSSLDPHRTLSPGGDEAWLAQVYDTLLRIAKTPDGAELVPELATSYEVSDDGLSVTFELRDGVTFQDGTPFNGEAVKANIERAKGADSTVVSQIPSIDTVEVLDDTHVVFHLTSPDPSVLFSMALAPTGAMVSPAAFSTDLNAVPVGTGPFKLVSAQQGADVVFERNEDYWDPDAVLVSKLTISTVADENARVNGLTSGTYDASFVGQDSRARDLEADGYQYLGGGPVSPANVLLNSNLAPFDDVRVRRAVSMALNRADIASVLFGEAGRPFYQPYGPAMLGYDPELDVDPFDPEAAKALVQEAGAEGATVTIIALQTPPFDSLAQVVQQSLNDIGLSVELLPLNFAEAREKWATGDSQALVAGVRGGIEPSASLTNTYLAGDNPATPPEELVAMADAAKALPYQSDEQKQAYQEIWRYLVENPIHVPIAAAPQIIVSRPNVVGADHLISFSISWLDFSGVGIAR
jgi:ABC-type transport system substrate-binding protein